jgi:hypothetical protein
MRNSSWLALVALCSTVLIDTASRPAAAQEAPAQKAQVGDASEPAAEDLKSTITRALDEFRAGRFREALALFDAAVGSSAVGDDRTTLEFNAAVCAYAIGNYADAQRRFEALATQSSKLSTLASVHAGLAALRAGDLPAARRHRLVTLSDDAELRRVYDQLVREIREAEQRSRREYLRKVIDQGFDAIDKGQLDAARRNLQHAEALTDAGTADDRADIHYGLGVIDYDLEALDAARRHFEICLAARASDAEAWLALASVCEAQQDAPCARRAYDKAIHSSAPKATQDRAWQRLQRLYRLPVGPSAFIAIGGGFDSNADQTGIRDLTGTGTSTQQTSGFVSGLVDSSWLFQTSLQTAVGPYYSADVIALLYETVRDLSLQTHELGLRFAWAPSLKTQLQLEGSAAYVLSGLDPVIPFAWEAAAGAKLELQTSQSSQARLRVGVRGSNATDLDYLDGYRIDVSARERWTLGNWELIAELLLRYNAAGVEETRIDANASDSCDSEPPRGRGASTADPTTCASWPYLIPLSYWSPGGDLGVAWDATDALRFSLSERLEHRSYTEASGLQHDDSPQKYRKDWRFRTLFGIDFALDHSDIYHLTLDHTLIVNTSNMALGAGSSHEFDYADRNFVQNISELGLQVWL